MRHASRAAAPVRLLMVLLAAGGAAPAQEADLLATRCEAIPWQVPQGSAEEVPRALQSIQSGLAQRGPAIVPVLEAACPASLHLRRVAPGVLRRWPSDRTRALLLRILADPDEYAAAAAARALGSVGGREVLPALARAVGHASPRVRHDALCVVGRLGALRSCWTAVLPRLADPRPFVRHVAVQLLERTSGAERIRVAAGRLRVLAASDGDAGVRRAVARALRVLAARRED